MPCDRDSVEQKARQIRLLLFDVDGVLTDGRLLLHSDGTESKQFAIRDGLAFVAAHRAGLRTGLISGRASASTQHRAAQLGIAIVHENVAAKLDTYEQVLASEGVDDAQVAYMGDDLPDLPVLARAGLACAPADAAGEIRARAHWVSRARGGEGAARELVELVLRAQDKWDALVASYLNGDRR